MNRHENENKSAKGANQSAESPCISKSTTEPVSLVTPLVKNTVHVSVLNAQTSALTDTGASISVVSKGFLRRSGFELDKLETASLTQVRGVSGNSIAVLGKICLPIKIAGIIFEFPFHVLESLHYPLIIGMDFLSQYQCNIDLSCGKLYLKEGNICACLSVDSACAKILKPVVIHAREEVEIPVSICRKLRNETVLLEPFPTDKCIQVARCLVKPQRSNTSKQNSAVVRVLNPTHEDVFLRKNFAIASISKVQTSAIYTLDDDSKPVYINSISENTSCDESLKFDISKNTNLTPEEQAQLKQFLNDNKSIFSNSLSTIGKSNVFTHKIETEPHAKPVHMRPYRQNPIQKAVIEESTKEFLENKIISPSTSVYHSPVVLVKKGGNSNAWRFAIDYRNLNKITKSISHPLPRLEDVFDSIGDSGATVFSTLDLNSAYFQMELDPETKHKSAFITHEGVYEWNRMPFGLKNAPMSFQMLMSQVLRGLHWKIVLCYIDDLVILSKSFKEHLEHLHLVFTRLREANLTLHPEKCHFGLERVMFLGHILSKDGVSVDTAKTDKVRNFPIPKSQTELKSYLGLCNYYRRFVKGFANIASPLNNLLKGNKKGKFKPGDWTEDCQNAFETLKTALTTAPVLGFPNMNKDFYLSADASGTALGYVLGQKDHGKENVIAYGGRALSKHERNWSVTDQECLAIIEGIKAFGQYLSHRKFTIYTDHKALSYLRSIKDPKGRIARWIMFLENYDYEVIYRPGTQNGAADGVSRIRYESLDQDEMNDVQIENVNENQTDQVQEESNSPCDENFPVSTDSDPEPIKVNVVSNSTTPDLDSKDDSVVEVTLEYGNPASINLVDKVEQTADVDMAALQRQCPDLSYLIEYLETHVLPDDEKKRKCCQNADDYFVIKDGLLHRVYQPHHKGKIDHTDHYIYQLAIPKCKIKDVLYHYHDSLAGGGHFGIKRTFHKLRQKYWFPQMHQQIIDYVSSCDTCQRSKVSRQQRPPPLNPLPVQDEPMARIHIDILGPLPKTKQGHQYILLIIDSFSKWSEAFPLCSQNAKEIASVLYHEFICRYGAPRSMLSDRGKNFMSKLVAALCELFDIKRYFTSSYHPQTNSTVERANSTLAKVLSSYVDDHQTNWASLIPSVMMAFRSTPATESHGFSPFQLVFGKEMVLPVDLDLLPKPSLPTSVKAFFDELLRHLNIARDIAKQNMEVAREKAKHHYDKKAREPDFQVGDKVFLRCYARKPGLSHKLSSNWDGPYEITLVGPHFTYQIKHCITNKFHKSLVNAQRLKHYQERIDSDHSDQEEREELYMSDNDPQTDAEQAPQAQPEPEQEPNVVHESQSDVPSQTVEAKVPQSSTVENKCPQSDQKSVECPAGQRPAPDPDPQTSKSVLVRPKRVFKITMSQGKRWFRCYIAGQKFAEWFTEDQLDPDFLCEYWETHTRTGHKRRRKGNGKIYFRSKPKE